MYIHVKWVKLRDICAYTAIRRSTEPLLENRYRTWDDVEIVLHFKLHVCAMLTGALVGRSVCVCARAHTHTHTHTTNKRASARACLLVVSTVNWGVISGYNLSNGEDLSTGEDCACVCSCGCILHGLVADDRYHGSRSTNQHKVYTDRRIQVHARVFLRSPTLDVGERAKNRNPC
jgi:hypothetical protein